VENYQAGTRKASWDVKERSAEASKRTKIAITPNTSSTVTLQVFYAWIFFLVLSPFVLFLSNDTHPKMVRVPRSYLQYAGSMK
jgi:hypothetical protein